MSPREAWRRLVDGPDPRPRQALQGLVLGLLACNTGAVLGLMLPWRFARFTALGYVLCGLVAMLGPAWLRRSWWVALFGLVSATLVVGYTPLAPALLQRLIVDDGPSPADAIVVLSASTNTASLGTSSEDRMLRGLQLLHKGWAPAIVFTGDPRDRSNQFHVMAPAMMASLGLPTSAVVPFEPVQAPVQTTYTEAQSIRLMATARGWRRLLLVTSPSHTRRAATVFRAAGLDVRTVASAVSRYDLASPRKVSDRLAIFRDWVYETTAWAFYRWKGRL